jgi:hypothetical protein
MAMHSVLCEVGNKWLNIDYFNFRLHRLTQPAIIRFTSACADHVNNDHNWTAQHVSSIKQGTGTKVRQMTKNRKLKKTSPWKLRKVGHKSPVEAKHSGSQREAPPGSFIHKIIYISLFAWYRHSHFFNLLSFLNEKRKLMRPRCRVCTCVRASQICNQLIGLHKTSF